MNDLILTDLLPKLGKYGVDVNDKDLVVYTETAHTIQESINFDPESAKEAIAKTFASICMTYLSIDAGSEVNVSVGRTIIKSIIVEYGSKLTINQLQHAFALHSRGKFDIDLNMYQVLKPKPILDLLRLYCGKKYKVNSAINKEKEAGLKLLSEPILSKEEGAEYLFSLWDKEEKFSLNANKLYAVGFGKRFITQGLLNLTDEDMQAIYNQLQAKKIVRTTEIVQACGHSDDGTILYEKVKVKIPIQNHPDLSGMTFDDIFTLCCLYEHFKNKTKNK